MRTKFHLSSVISVSQSEVHLVWNKIIFLNDVISAVHDFEDKINKF